MDSRIGFEIAGTLVFPGETREVYLKVSESYMSKSIQVPITVMRGRHDGPTAYIVAAVHGDEINGADIVRRLIFDVDHEKLCGTLIAIPVVNIPGFLAQSRYLPYHRDLNRFFPGKPKGNNAERFAWKIFHEVVKKCDFGIDLHTAAAGRLNLPHVRGDLSHPRVRAIARGFQSMIMIDQKGGRGTLRREATESGVPTIVFEAGETTKFSPKISIEGLRGVLSVLEAMDMWKGGQHPKSRKSSFQVIIKKSDWIRSDKGGILDLKIRPGDLVYQGDPIAIILNPFGRTVVELKSPWTGIVIGVTTAPLSIPGTGIAHIAKLKKTLKRVEKAVKRGRAKKRSKQVRMKGRAK